MRAIRVLSRRSTASAHQAPCPAGPSCPLCNTTCTDEARPDARSSRRAGRVENPPPLTPPKHAAPQSPAADPRQTRAAPPPRRPPPPPTRSPHPRPPPTPPPPPPPTPPAPSPP